MKVKKATYEMFITGPVPRFDDRNGGFSKLQRGEIAAPDNLEKTGEGAGTVIERALTRDTTKEEMEGYRQEDYALKQAGRTVDVYVRKHLFSRDSDVDENKVDTSDRAATTRKIKRVARWFGADQVGICEINPAWIYSHWGDNNSIRSGIASAGDPIELPSWAKYAVVMVIAMDYQRLRRSPAVEGGTDLAYSQMAFTASSLATYIRKLGYHAISCGNDMALSVPLAIDAGLGELGRHGLLITEGFGPRVRLCKVFTELPLATDSPVDMGVQHFCEECKICADSCPSRAIVSGDRTDKAWDSSNSINVLKWPVKTMNCLSYWLKNRADCAVCIRTCPFNKPDGMVHTAVRKTIEKTSAFDGFFVRMDRAFRYGEQTFTELDD
jgi:reductive dehalogenase